MFTWWWDDAKDWLLWWGAVLGCCECVITLVQVLMKLVTVRKKGGDIDLDRATLMRFMFMPGQQLVNLFPAKEPVW